MCTVTQLVLSKILSHEDRGQETVDLAPRCDVGAGFLLVSCGRLDTFPVSFARRCWLLSLPDTDLRSNIDFSPQAGRQLAGFAVVYHSFAPAIPPAAPGRFRNCICTSRHWRFDLSPE